MFPVFKSHFKTLMVDRVKTAAMGIKGNVWKAVKIAKNLNADSIPANLTLAGIPVAAGDVANSFARYFYSKVINNVTNARIDSNGVYNGKCKIIVQNSNFMTRNDVKECMSVLANKKSEGYDRIPVCALKDAKRCLLEPMAALFNKIYETMKVPEQWKIAKILPVFKKGSVNKIESAHPTFTKREDI